MSSNYLRGYLRLHFEDHSSLPTMVSSIQKAKYYLVRELIIDLTFASSFLSSTEVVLNTLATLYLNTFSCIDLPTIIIVPQVFGEISRQNALRSSDVLIVFREAGQEIDFELVSSLKQQMTEVDPVILELETPSSSEVIDAGIRISESIVGKHAHTVLGGTFDYLHAGHKTLLTGVALVSAKGTGIGITSGQLLKNKSNAPYIQEFEERERNVRYFLEVLAPYTTVHTFEIIDPIGPAGTEEIYNALVFTTEVRSMFGTINEAREKNGLEPLDGVEISLMNIGESKISSTQIRESLSVVCEGCYLELREQFKQLVSDMNIDKLIGVKWWDIVAFQYMRDFRYYHILSHIKHMLGLLEKSGYEKNSVLLIAIWFHDVIYYTDHRGFNEGRNNEMRSKDLLHCFILETGLDEAFYKAEEYILATIEHQLLTGEFDEKLMLDVDLGILSESREEYLNYIKKVRSEYSHFPDDVFYPKRKEFMREFLQREEIYFTPYFKERETQARQNIEFELSLEYDS